MIYLETKRLILRNYKNEDINDVHEYFGNEDVSKYEDFYPKSKDEVKEMMDGWIDKDNRLVAELKDQHKVIGSVGYFVDEDGDYSMDFDFNTKFQKKGYALEAATELLNYLFDTLHISSIYGDCDIRNANSWKLLEKLGFQRIDQLDNESYKDDADGNPIPISIYIYKKYTK